MIKHKMNSDATGPSNVAVLKSAEPGSTRRLLKVVLAVLVLAVVTGAGAWYYHRHSKTPAQYQGQALKDAIDKSNASGDYAGTARLIEVQKNQTYGSRIQLATAYLNDKQYDKALGVLGELDKQGRLLPAHSILAAMTAEQKGDKKLALTYYRQAKARLDPKGGSGARRQLRECNQKIAELDATS